MLLSTAELGYTSLTKIKSDNFQLSFLLSSEDWFIDEKCALESNYKIEQ